MRQQVVLVSTNKTRWSAVVHLNEGESLPRVLTVEHRVFVQVLNAGHTFVEWASKAAFNLVVEIASGPVKEIRKFDSVPILLWCPVCGTQHVDRGEWARTPHKSHLCCECQAVWRPADVPTVGITALTTRGSGDTWPTNSPTDCVVCSRPTDSRVCYLCRDRWSDLVLRLLTDQRLGPGTVSYRSDRERNMSDEDRVRRNSYLGTLPDGVGDSGE